MTVKTPIEKTAEEIADFFIGEVLLQDQGKKFKDHITRKIIAIMQVKSKVTDKSAADRVLELEQSYEWFIPTDYITRPILDSEQMDELANLAPALARQVKELEAEREWRPIETAPKEIEFRCLLAHRYSVVVGYWDGESWINERSRTGNPYSPTHWMPLPERPND